MAVTGLIIAILTLGVQLTQSGAEFINALNSLHQHTTAPAYRHTVKPVGKGIKKAVKVIAQ